MAKTLNDFLYNTPASFFRKNRTDLCKIIAGCTSGGSSSGVTTFNGRPGDVVLTSLDVTTALTYTPYNGTTNPNNYISTVPAQTWASITGKPTTVATSGLTDAATTTQLGLKANSASPTFTGAPLAPTATAGTNTTQIATTAFVTTAVTNKTVSLQQATTTGNVSSNELLITGNTLAGTAKGLHIAFDSSTSKSTFTNIDVADNTNTTNISMDLHNLEFFLQGGFRILGLNDQQSGGQAAANFNGRVKIEDAFLDNEATSLGQLKSFAAKSGNTASRPGSPLTGQMYFDTEISPAKPIWYNGTAWVDATGTTV